MLRNQFLHISASLRLPNLLSRIFGLILFIIPGLAISQSARLQFQRVTVDQGLSYSDVNNICQDSAGFMWFGAYLGLSRFDGREIRSIDMRDVYALCTDRNGNIWIGGTYGFHCVNSSKDTMVNYDLIGVRAIIVDEDSTLWVGADKGLFHVDPKTDRIMPIGEEATAGAGVNSMAMDKQGNLWLVTKSSIVRFNKASRQSRIIRSRSDQPNSGVVIAPNGMIWLANGESYHLSRIDPRSLALKNVLENGRPVSATAVAVDSLGIVYIGTAGQGLKIYDPASGIWQTYVHSDFDPQSLLNNVISCLSFDRTGNLWIGTPTGVSWATRLGKGFNWISALTADEETRPTTIQSVAEDDEGNLWLGAYGGLKKWDRKRSVVVSVKAATHRIGCLRVVGGHTLWIALAPEGGLLQLDTRGTEMPEARTLGWPGIKERITAMYCDGDTVVWLGCIDCKLYRLNLRTRTRMLYRYETFEQLFPGRVVSWTRNEDCPRTIYRDRMGTLWIATYFGILSLDERTGNLKRYLHSTVREPSAQENTWCVYEDTKGRFWVGNDLGLDLFDRTRGTFRLIIQSSQRLSGKTVVGIIEDKTGVLWLQTDGMLLNYSHHTGKLKQYGAKDGFPTTHQGLFFVYGNSASCLTQSGEIAIGLSDGFVLFRPDELWDNLRKPESVVMTSVDVLGDSLRDIKKRVTAFSLPEQPLKLPAGHNDLEFTFAGLDYRLPSQIKYAVWLEPMDRGWSNLGTQNSVRFMNLSPGSYRLRVKAANGDSAWSEREATFTFEILPPWWRTQWAYSLYVLFIISTLYLSWRMQLGRVRNKHALAMTRFEAEKLQEVDEMKSRFFANISHEFRTPLTLILGPVKQLAERMEDEKAKEELSMVHRNARKLLTLVNQLLDISKIESGNMKLQASPRDINRLLKNLVVSFTPYAERKKITLKFATTESAIPAYLDKEKFESIVTNVLSNAFKFTPEAGLIELSVSRDDHRANIRISDTGIGIPKEKLPRIFDRFYQVNGTHTRDQEGTGIGLALTKELVELHKGTIAVESEEGRGTVVTVSIPLGKKHLKPEEIVDQAEREEEVAVRELASVPFENPRQTGLIDTLGIDSNRPNVLLVEDNSDVRYYIRKNIENDYCLLETADGEEGWFKATECLPDIVVSDVMMPKMDGFELCKKLKTDERTSHIPVILLTAKAATQDKIEGFETGADAYIMKPFEPEELKARIKNLIEQRKRLQDHFRRHGIVGIDESKIMSIDKKFLKKVFHIIAGNISNASFGVESLAEMAAVSRSVLHRKIVSLTGEAPVELIRRIRLAKAAEMIEKKVGNMSEIALEVGFANPSYFSECFKKQYGVSPSEYHSEIGHD